MPKAAPHMKREQLEALQARVARGLRAPDRAGKAQLLTLAEQYADKLRKEWWPEADKIMQPLRDACVPPAAPQRAPATIGALRELIAGMPDGAKIEEIPGASPEWIASLVKLLALVPPVQRVERPLQWSKPPGPGNLAPASKPEAKFLNADNLGL